MTATELPLLKPVNSFTSDGSKFGFHTEAMDDLRNGKPHVITCHLMPTDTCDLSCSFCSVLTREGNSLTMREMEGFLDQLIPIGLRATIVSGGGNPILYKCKETGNDFNDLIDMIHSKGLEIGLITNGMAMRDYNGRKSWKTVRPETLDKCTWIRISMAGLDHDERKVHVPDIDKSKTTLGFSYVLHDTYHVKEEPNHGKVSTLLDVGKWTPTKIEYANDRLPWIEEQIKKYVEEYSPTYVRALPNCLENDKIPERCEKLQEMADRINPDVVFVQYKPGVSPSCNKCWLGYIHPVLNSDSFVYPCDACVLNKSADHKFANPWRMCHWSEIGEFYNRPMESLIKDPKTQCPQCVFSKTVDLLDNVKNGIELPIPNVVPTHPNFV
jgi:wyosine [tRNA(Phe)-imidazoG37] synthetase (radical SAM superfamily)